MKNIFKNAEKFMHLLGESPEVKALLHAEKRKEFEASKQARSQCIALIRACELRMVEKEKALLIEKSAMEAAESKLAVLKSKVCIADFDLSQERSTYSNFEKELSRVHGDDVVHKTLYLLNGEIYRIESQINILELAKNPTFKNEHGSFSYRPVPPGIDANQQTLRDRQEACKGLYEKAKGFIRSDMEPGEIRGLCESICAAVGFSLQLVQVTEQEA
jgi:hypothetical protein